MKQVDKGGPSLWDQFGKVPRENGWQEESLPSNVAEGIVAYTIFDRHTENGRTNEVSGRVSLAGKIPNALAAATFHQAITEGEVKRGVQVDITNEGLNFPSLRRMTVAIHALDPYPPAGELPEEGTQVVLLFDRFAYLQVARTVAEDEMVEDLQEKLAEGEIEPQIEDRPLVWKTLHRLGLDATNYRLRRLDVGETMEELVLGASPLYNEQQQLLNPPDDILALLVFKEVDELQRYVDTHAPEDMQFRRN